MGTIENNNINAGGHITVLDLVMIAPIQLQCIFSCTNLANPEVEPHAPNTHQSKLVPGGSIKV